MFIDSRISFHQWPEYRGRSLVEWLSRLDLPYPEERLEAIEALVQIGDASAPSAARLLKEGTDRVRSAAHTVLLRLIREKHSSEAVRALAGLADVQNQDQLSRIVALEALARCGPVVLQLLPEVLPVIKAPQTHPL